MAFSINTNIASLQAQNYLQTNSNFQAHTISEVTSGLRIVNSGDDAAGLAIANGFRSDEAVLTQGIQNANNGMSTLQTVDGGMSNISTLLDRARTLATESSSGTFTGNRSTLNAEFQSVIQEVNRQAQAIGMNQGGQFAQALSVFIGGGKGVTSAAASTNGSINLDLSKSAVDAQSLGLQGVQAVGAAGTDIGSGSANTSVQSILANAINSGSQGTAGSTTFTFSGPGFGDSNKISVSVNLAGVTDTTTLTTAINSAIQNAGNGTTQSATAFKNANITASTVTDASGKQQLAFNSSTSAFQVQAGDKTANALLGNFAQNASLKGTDNNAYVNGNLGLTSLNVNGTAVSLSSATTAALAAGGSSGGVSGAATVSDATIAGLNSGAGITAGQTLKLTVDGSGKTITFTGGEKTLSQVASEITASNNGVTASIAGSGSNQQLVLTSNTTGSSSNVDVLSTGSLSAASMNALGFSSSATTSGTAGSAAAATVSKASIVNALNSDANFKNAATASLDGNKVVITSNNNSSASSVQIAGSLATALGFSTTTATAASASTGASLNTTVQAAGTITANQNVISSLTAPTAAVATGTNDTLNISIGGATAVSLTLTAGSATNAAAMADINTQIAGSALAGKVAAGLDNAGHLTLTATTPGQSVTVGGTGDTAAANLGFGASNSASNSSPFVTSSDNIKVKFTGAGMTSPVTLSLAATTDGTTKVSDVIADLTSQVAGNSALAAAGISITSNTAGNNLVFTDNKGEKFQVAVTGDSNNILGFGSFNADVNGSSDYSTISGSAALGTTTAASTLNISLNGGATTKISIAAGSATATVTSINAQIATNSTLSGAGLQASLDLSTGALVLKSSNGSNFRVSAGGADLGFGTTGGAYAGTTDSAAPTVGRVDSAGAYTSTSMGFKAMANGGDSQTVSITATDPSGGTHSQAITLQNNSTARTGDNIDDAIHAINTKLQQSNDSTLQSIYAVKENNSDGTESIKFQSTTQNFKVAVSSLSDGTGMAAPTGGISSAAQNGSGANVSIDTISGAQSAVNALATAVQNLGAAQAAVGKGENNLNYAISLAQSQVTNEAASESQLRDANLAQQAANLTKAQILVQAGTAALAQANSAPQQLLSLLK
jgi:flagellin